MIDFIMILLFSETVRLTDNPVTLRGSTEIRLQEPVKAITKGASIQIDVSSFFSKFSGENEESTIANRRATLAEMFPESSIRVILSRANSGRDVVLDRISIAVSNDDERLVMSASSGLETGIEYSLVTIESSVEVIDVVVFWKNFSN